MQRDPKMLKDGCADLERGMNSGVAPNLIARNQAFYIENGTVRGGFLHTRPGFKQIKFKYYATPQNQKEIDYNALVDALLSGKFQGALFYDAGMERGAIMVQSGGRQFLLSFQGPDMAVSDASIPGDYDSTRPIRVYYCQAEQYMVKQDGQSLPLIFNGSTSRRSDLAAFEVPMGSGPMAYGMQRLWVAKGRNYVGGDLANGPNGVLSFKENAFIFDGGEFVVSLQTGNISGMIFLAQNDVQQGVGDLVVATPQAMFACNVPTDRLTWQNQQTPLQTVMLKSSGAVSHWSMSTVNSDLFFRSDDGDRSLIQARRDFGGGGWGNTPISNEVNRILDGEAPDLRKWISAVVFDNRRLYTCLPQPLPNQVYFKGLVALDFDLISTMAEKQPPAYDGLWIGPFDPYHVVSGRFGQLERAFIFARSQRFSIIETITMLEKVQLLIPPHAPSPITISGGGGAGATAAVIFGLWDIGITFAGGVNYVVGDVIVMDTTGANFNRATVLKVTGVDGFGSVTSFDITDPGEYLLGPTLLNPWVQSVTSGVGTGFTITKPDFYMQGIVVTNPGHGYTSVPTILLTQGVNVYDCTCTFSSQLELWEISTDLDYDYPLDANGDPVETPITTIVETGSYAFTQGSNGSLAKKLAKARLHVDEVSGTVLYTLQYKPDQNPCWQPWYSWSICGVRCGKAATIQEVFLQDGLGHIITDGNGLPIVVSSTSDCQWRFYQEQYRPRMLVPTPPDGVTDKSSGMPARIGREFQARLSWTGRARLKLLELWAEDIQEEVNPPVVKTETTCREIECAC